MEDLKSIQTNELKECNSYKDIQDAYRCAYIAYMFATKSIELAQPDDDIPEKEGWVWYLKNILPDK